MIVLFMINVKHNKTRKLHIQMILNYKKKILVLKSKW